MRNLSTTIATYPDRASAEKDWHVIEESAKAETIDMADAALVVRDPDGGVTTVDRLSHHGWGKGAVAGAVVGILWPPTLLAGAVTGAASGGLIARLNRSLDKGNIKDLGKVMEPGEIALVVLTTEDSLEVLNLLLGGATKVVTKASASAEEVQQALAADAADADSAE
jgi:uncharacterized membrane protein